MSEYELGGEEFSPFDAEHLKTLSERDLFEAVVDDVQLTITYLDESKRTQYEERLIGACWVLNDEEQEALDEWQQELNTAFDNLSATIVNMFVEPEDAIEDPEEATRMLKNRRANRSLYKIEGLKQEIAYGVEHGRDEQNVPWVHASTRYTLLKIIEAQEEAGIDIASDYVRDTALESLESVGERGVVLLKNALNGDETSYSLALEALRDAASSGELSYDVVHIGIESINDELLDGNPTEERRKQLIDLGIDLLARMRQWNNPSNYFESYNTHYITTAAEFAAAVRNGAAVA